MKAATAIGKFMKQPTSGPFGNTPPSITEIKELKEACTSEEWQEYGKQAAEAMGEEFTPA